MRARLSIIIIRDFRGTIGPAYILSDRLAAASGTSRGGSLGEDSSGSFGLGVYDEVRYEWRRWPWIPRRWRRKKGEGVGIDGHKKRKGPKVNVLMNREGLPLSVAVGVENAHDRRMLEEVRGAFG
jgi:hypothetical protein